MKNKFRLFLIALLFIAGNLNTALAQSFSYVYIQGDKKTPIYTKVEGVMMPRYGKNYALLSRLAPGPLNVEILFQQNEFPPLTFTILVPENGKRAFVLNRKGDEFSLYDVEQNFYLKPGNTESDDHLPTVLNNNSIKPIAVKTEEEPVVIAVAEEKPIVKSEQATVQEEPKTIMPEEQTPAINNEVAPQNPTPDTTAATAANQDSTKPKFIEDITFNNDANTPNTSAAVTVDNTAGTPATTGDAATASIPNSDCASAMSQTNFQRLLNSVNARKKEEERIALIQNSAKQNCLSTEQAKQLLEKIDTDLGKLSAIKSLYSKITNQAEFLSLESMLTEEDSKAYFKMLTKQ